MVHARRDWKHIAYRALEHRKRVLSVFWRRLSQQLLELDARRTAPRRVRTQGVKAAQKAVGGGFGKAPHLLGRQSKSLGIAHVCTRKHGAPEAVAVTTASKNTLPSMSWSTRL